MIIIMLNKGFSLPPLALLVAQSPWKISWATPQFERVAALGLPVPVVTFL